MIRASSRDKTVFRPWPEEMYRCDGDYRRETFLENHIGGPLYENQNELPILPIPTIEESIRRFLPTALPLAKTKEEEFALRAACERFPEEARALQNRLQERRDNEMKDSSWLQMWWNQVSPDR